MKKSDFHQPNAPQTATAKFQAKQFERQHQGRASTPVGPFRTSRKP